MTSRTSASGPSITTRAAGSFSLSGDDPIGEVMTRWQALRSWLGVEGPGSRFATSVQVHGARVIWHQAGWEGWLRADAADGHCSAQRGHRARGSASRTACRYCWPIRRRDCGLLHAGWRGTAARILRGAIAVMAERRCRRETCGSTWARRICGALLSRWALTSIGNSPGGGRARQPRRSARHPRRAGSRVRAFGRCTISPWCTRCDNAMFFSHRCGDSGRQVAALVATR